MKISREQLLKQATLTGFKAEMLEKVWHLIGILDGINAHPYLQNRLVLKGGTALNLFLLKLPRLSIDIDLNYIGQVERGLMQEERPLIEAALQSICAEEGLEMRRAPNINNPGSHAGGKFQFKYESASGNKGNLEVDVNYMYRSTLWEPQNLQSIAVGEIQTKNVSILATEEIVAGKLSALFSRQASRDLFDVHHLMHNLSIDHKKLKVAFLIYGIMGPNDFRDISLKQISFDKNEYYQNLIPVLRKEESTGYKFFDEWSSKIEIECKNALKELVTFNVAEKRFLEQFYSNGEVDIELITEDKNLAQRVGCHPLLLWRKQQLDLSRQSALSI